MKHPYSLQRIFLAVASIALLLAVGLVRGQNISEYTDDAPDNRVARIKLLEGDVRIKRNDTEAWETAELNLPLITGDEIATGGDGRIEIQFDIDTYLRIAPNSIVKIKSLDYSGIAVGIPRGAAVASLRKFDRERGFFEIDLPETTVAVLKSGIYRFESLDYADGEVRVGVSGNGEARVYSADSGFRLRSGRLARVALSGNYAGDWEIANYDPPVDDLDRWATARQREIDRRIAAAYYDKYYDYNIYGADELDGYGNWEFTSDYGYVWQPSPYAIRTYNDWSPYRYGRWRWIPPIGWTWISDEPWGWATYHYGRWVWYRGRWVWSPYGYYRSNRSRWYPALVVVYVVNNNVCWYPLGYRQRYRSFNNYHDWVGNRDRSRTPVTTPNSGETVERENRFPQGSRPPLGQQLPQIDENTTPGGNENRPYIPPNAIISMRKEAFLAQRNETVPAPPEIVRAITRRAETSNGETTELPVPGTLPTGNELRRAEPPLAASLRNGSTGAAQRTEPGPIDEQLRRNRMFGGRNPQPLPAASPSNDTERPTGAVTRSSETRGGQGRPPASLPADAKRDAEPPIFRPRTDGQQIPAPRKPDDSGEMKQPRREAPPKGNDSPPFNPMPVPRRETPPPPKQEPPRKEEPPQQKPFSRKNPKEDG